MNVTTRAEVIAHVYRVGPTGKRKAGLRAVRGFSGRYLSCSMPPRRVFWRLSRRAIPRDREGDGVCRVRGGEAIPGDADSPSKAPAFTHPGNAGPNGPA